MSRNIKVKIKWDFEDTEFEMFRYSEALIESGLPKRITIKNYDEEEIDIESYLIEEYGFTPESWEVLD